jgi:signal transduction histidine kinase
MSGESVMPPTDGPVAPAAFDDAAAGATPAWPDPAAGSWGDAEDRARTLERLIGVRSSKPTFYAAWRDNTARLDRTIETLQRISTALCATPDGPGALCDAVVEAAAHHFDAPWAALCFTGATGDPDPEPPHVVRRIGDRVLPAAGDPPAMLGIAIAEALEADAPVAVAERPEGPFPDSEESSRAVAAPLPVRGETAGVLAVGLLPDATVASTDISILVTLANHAGVALHNARLFQESERLRRRSESVSRLARRRAAELQRRTDELEGIRLRLENAGRRELLSQERTRIARELHDSVAQHLLTIGMNLEWCRRQETTPGPVLDRVATSKSLARSAVDEIRSVIFELTSDGQGDLRRALREVVGDVVAGTTLRVGLRTYGQPQPISGAAQHALVQIAREALFNVVRHANADRAWLSLRWQTGQVRLVIADDGTGDPAALQGQLQASRPAEQHFGLSSIGGRVRELAGSVSFGRRRGGGVSLAVELPLGGAGVGR